tara:strand:+ start:5690 stop:6667 length:978 start_codon:yes stop_codon:yes gene_type:complete
MKKTIYLIIFLTLAIAVNAGCFTNPDSTSYCQDLSQAQAKDECTILNCQFEDFYQEKSCKKISECQEIMCKSSCTKTTQGECIAGGIPQGDEQLFCSEGCCLFNYLNENYCDFTKTQWLCEVEAKNKRSTEIYYEASTKFDCLTLCNKPLQEKKAYIQGKTKEPVVATAILFQEEELVPPPKQTKTPSNKSDILLYVILLILSIAIVVFFVHKYKHFTEPSLPSKRSKEWYHLLVPKTSSKIPKIKQYHTRKSKTRSREGYLADQGFPVNKKPSHFFKLDRITTKHQQKKEIKKEAPIIFNKLKEISKKPKPKEDIIKSLRKIVK